MSEDDDVDQNEARRTSGADNDVFSTDFISKMHPNFRSPVPVQSPAAETGIDPPDAGSAVPPPLEVVSTPPEVTTGSSIPLEVPTPEIAEPQPGSLSADAPMVS
jgi:hypothetical protein